MQNAVKLQWSSEIRALFAATMFDGVVNVYSYHDAVGTGLMKGKKGAAELTAPVWLQRRAGTTFGFGGKLATFGAQDKASTAMGISTFVQDTELCRAAREFDALVSQSSTENLCAAKVLRTELTIRLKKIQTRRRLIWNGDLCKR